LSRNIRVDPIGVFAIIDLLTFELIMTALSTFPAIQAKKIKVSWVGDEKLKKGDEHIEEFRAVVKSIEEGRGGGGERRSSTSSLKILTVHDAKIEQSL
jgi:hypothetical protein